MGDNSKILEDISALTQICRSNNDGPTLRIEENEIKNKLVEYDEEIEEIKTADVDDSYDTSAEMADRNIEIITKKVIQATTNELKSKNAEMDSLKEKEAEYSNSLYALKRTKVSYEKYIASLKDRLTSATEDSVTERYNSIISNTEAKMAKQDERIKEMEEKHSEIQSAMDKLHEEIVGLENRLEAKKALLAEAQNNLQNRDLYIDKAKKEKAAKRVEEIEGKKEELSKRLDEISRDPKYLEMKIKEILLDGSDNYAARNYIVELLTIASKVPYADRYVDKKMEEELLSATQERDSFAGEIDSKTYDIMDLVSPEQIRVDFLNSRISYWQSEIKKLEEKVSRIDKDENFHYAEKNVELDDLISKLKDETKEFKTRYQKESDSNLSNKAILKLTYEEKKADLAAAEEIASKFRKNEAEDVEDAGKIVKQDIEELNKRIKEAEDEINQIKDRLNNRKSGNKDLSAKNKDREKLEELAQVVIDIKHRRQFADRTFDIAKRLEFNLGMKLIDAVYTKEEQEKLSAEVMVPIEEEKKEEPVVMETVEQPEKEVSQIEKEVVEQAQEITEPVESKEEVQGQETTEIIEPKEEVQEETAAEDTNDSIQEEKDEEVKTASEEITTVDSIAEAIPAVESVEEAISEPEEEQSIDVPENTASSIDQNEQPVEYSIPELTPSIEETFPLSDANDSEEPAVDIEIQAADDNEELPPLPDISSDDTTSIPVIPVAEPSTDDNYEVNSEEPVISEQSLNTIPEENIEQGA